MHKVIDGTKIAPHGMFYLEDAGGCDVEPAAAPNDEGERKPSCFALEEEKGEGWHGIGAMKPVKETRPTL